MDLRDAAILTLHALSVYLKMSSFYDLPDEILLEVVHHLNAMRSFETQSEAFRHREAESGRQRENHIRQQTLYALCLVSHRLRYLSLPILYSSSIACATRHGYRSLQLLHRTFSDPNSALGQTKRLAEHVRYIENRLEDYRGNSLQIDPWFQDGPLTTYFQLLAKLVLSAPNLEHACIISLEHEEVSFWKHILGSRSGPFRRGFLQLKHLSAQIHAYPNSSQFEYGRSQFERILQRLRLLPSLSDLRISGADASSGLVLAFRPNEIANLSRLDLTKCGLEIIDVANLLLGCKNLRQFICKWQLIGENQVGPSVLLPALLSCVDTLETLVLDWREVRDRDFIESDSAMLGSLKSLSNLRSLEICELGFVSDRDSSLDRPGQVLDSAISELLPEDLEEMTLLYKGEKNIYEDNVLENALCLWRLSNDCKISIPHLRKMCIKAKQPMVLPSLTNEFARAGIQLRSEVDL